VPLAVPAKEASLTFDNIVEIVLLADHCKCLKIMAIPNPGFMCRQFLPPQSALVGRTKNTESENNVQIQTLTLTASPWHATCNLVGHRLTANEVPNTARRAFIEAKKPIESGTVQ
jgi:hypothetical protein